MVFGVALLLPAAATEVVTKGTAQILAGTDNQGKEGLVHKWLTTKVPLGLVALELAAPLAARPTLRAGVPSRRRRP